MVPAQSARNARNACFPSFDYETQKLQKLTFKSQFFEHFERPENQKPSLSNLSVKKHFEHGNGHSEGINFEMSTSPASTRKNDLSQGADFFGPHPQYGWDCPEEILKNSGKIPETLSERFLEFPSRVQLGCPKSYNSRHLRLPEHFQKYLPPSTAGDASFFRSGSGEGLSEPVMEFPAVPGVLLIFGAR